MSPRKDLVETYFDGFRRSDHDKILACLTDDVAWDLPGYRHLTGNDAFAQEIENEEFVGSPTLTVDRLIEAAGTDVRLGGGVAAIQQYLRAGLIDEMHVPIVPILLGRGERLFENLDGGSVGYECVEFVASPGVAHARLVRI